jgi:hypothetical protein
MPVQDMELATLASIADRAEIGSPNVLRHDCSYDRLGLAAPEAMAVQTRIPR